jgi:hypothetical protein
MDQSDNEKENRFYGTSSVGVEKGIASTLGDDFQYHGYVWN